MTKRRHRHTEPTQAAIQAASARWDRKGCHGCGTRWAAIETVMQSPAGRLAILCPACVTKPGWTPVAFGATWTDYGATDRVFFAANIGITHRVREPQPGELAAMAETRRLRALAAGGEATPPLPADTLVLAVQIRPGERTRLAIEPERARDPEAVAEAAADARAQFACMQDAATLFWATQVAPLAPALAAAERLGIAPSFDTQARAQGEANRTHATRH
jgi:hypothetical protein